ncbi:GNAT family N-acetyltransferase [Lacrimispora sp.]|jgi:ribosomal protein S18 acetylase RimI-like enzyme|uniref:GNAT family N-acetyltransferase n=1 Tax=Lacrimispora sp. TaxID=2719234 RepID=UPI0028A75FF1|nr:GNAT family N-acetyltransferase [Lacrimispora sp.]
MNDITYKITKENIDWQQVSDILRRSGLSDHTAKEQETIFTNSYAVVFVYHKETLVGVGRALSDGVCQAAIYNIALEEKFQGNGTGKKLINLLLDQVKGQNVILYTHPRTVALYEKMGFRRSKTAMCIYNGSEESRSFMEREGFLLPEKYRFVDEYGREDMKRS